MGPFMTAMASNESVSVAGLRVFLKYALENDLQILINRREAKRLLNAAILSTDDSEGFFDYPVEKFEKIQTFLELSETQQHGSPSQVSVYAFVRLMGDMRRAFKAHLVEKALPTSPFGSPAGKPQGQAGERTPR